MKSIRWFVPLVLLALSIPALADSPDRNRIEQLGGPERDRFHAVIQSGGTVFFGGAKDGVGLLQDAWLYATDLGGNALVDVTYRDASGRPAVLRSLAINGALWAAGELGTGSVDLDVFVMQLDEDGQILYQAALDLAGDQIVGDLVELSDGGALLVGSTAAPGAIRSDAWAVRFDASGAIRWQRVLSTLGEDRLRTAVETATGDLLLGGQGGVGRQIDGFQGWIVRLDADGNLLSHQGYELGQSDRVNQLIPVKRGFVGIGVAFETSFEQGQAWILDLDENGAITRSRLVGDFRQLGHDEFVAGAETPGGGFVATGVTDTIPGPSRQLFAVEFDNRGDPLWSRHFGGAAFEVAGDAIRVRGGGGGLMLAGSTQSVGTIDAWAVKSEVPPPDGTECPLTGSLFPRTVDFTPRLGVPFLTVRDSAAVLTPASLVEGSSPTTATGLCSF